MSGRWSAGAEFVSHAGSSGGCRMSTCPLPPFLTSATWGPQDSARVSGAYSAFVSSATGFGGGKEFNGVDPSAVQFGSVRFGSVLFGSVQLSSV